MNETFLVDMVELGWIVRRVERCIAPNVPRPGDDLDRCGSVVPGQCSSIHLDQLGRRIDGAGQRRTERPTVRPPVVVPTSCRGCGGRVPTGRDYCDACLPEVTGQQRAGFVSAGRAELRRQREAGADPSHGGDAGLRRAVKIAASRHAPAEWERPNGPLPDPEAFRREVLPLIKDATAGSLAGATGLWRPYCAAILRGERVPHADDPSSVLPEELLGAGHGLVPVLGPTSRQAFQQVALREGTHSRGTWRLATAAKAIRRAPAELHTLHPRSLVSQRTGTFGLQGELQGCQPNVRLVPMTKVLRHRQDGQSVTEFALVLPILLMLLLAVADFGRVFAAGIVVQAASRDGAEAAAQQYVQLAHSVSSGHYSLTSGDYAALHATAERVACAEAQRMLGTSLTIGDSGVLRCAVPAIAVCVHDGGDGTCGATLGQPTPDEAASCSNLTASWVPPSPTESKPLPYVEVRMCYPFSMLISNEIVPVATVHLQASSNFVAVTY